MRAKVEIEEANAGKKNLVITELPIRSINPRCWRRFSSCRRRKKGILSGISDIRDESDRTERAVIELKREVDAQKVLAYLYRVSDLQNHFPA